MCVLTKKLARSRIVTLTFENSYVILTVDLFSSKIPKGLKLNEMNELKCLFSLVVQLLLMRTY